MIMNKLVYLLTLCFMLVACNKDVDDKECIPPALRVPPTVKDGGILYVA